MKTMKTMRTWNRSNFFKNWQIIQSKSHTDYMYIVYHITYFYVPLLLHAIFPRSLNKGATLLASATQTQHNSCLSGFKTETKDRHTTPAKVYMQWELTFDDNNNKNQRICLWIKYNHSCWTWPWPWTLCSKHCKHTHTHTHTPVKCFFSVNLTGHTHKNQQQQIKRSAMK